MNEKRRTVLRKEVVTLGPFAKASIILVLLGALCTGVLMLAHIKEGTLPLIALTLSIVGTFGNVAYLYVLTKVVKRRESLLKITTLAPLSLFCLIVGSISFMLILLF